LIVSVLLVFVLKTSNQTPNTTCATCFAVFETEKTHFQNSKQHVQAQFVSSLSCPKTCQTIKKKSVAQVTPTEDQ
jgi:hypothetical protein